MTRLLWHYILGPTFDLVVHSGVLLPDTDVEGEHVPCIWFAHDHKWDKQSGDITRDHPTDRLYRSNRNQIAKRERGLNRISVGSETVQYERWVYNMLVGASRWDPVPLPRAAYRVGLCNRFCLEPITSKDWKAVQVWQDGTWMNVTFEKYDCGPQP